MRPVVAIVGRPNVGKSTLFNRFVGFRKAVVHDRPGVTRDRLYQQVELHDRKVLLVDTGGLEPDPDTDLLSSMRRQSLMAVEEAEVIVFVVDGRAGFTPADEEVADLLRRSSKPVLLAVNKIDGHKHEELSADFWSVGIQPMFTISAEHGRGVYELMDGIVAELPPATAAELDEDVDDGEEDVKGPIRMAVIGRPNIGKSTLINRLIGKDRHVVNDESGTTMDPIDSKLQKGDRQYVLVDTAGVRKQAKITDKLESWVSLAAIRSIERCHIALLMIDGTLGPTDQDARLAQLVIDRGRALVILVNKWDLRPETEGMHSGVVEENLEMRLPHAIWAPHLFISALTGKGVHKIISTVDRVFEQFNKRITTSELNRWLERVVHQHTPPQQHHHPVRIYYATQTRVRPPTFAVFSNTPDGIAPPYQRYMMNKLREAYDFEGSPLRINLKKRRKSGDNDD